EERTLTRPLRHCDHAQAFARRKRGRWCRSLRHRGAEKERAKGTDHERTDSMFGRLLILLLSVLPKHAMSRVAGSLANLRIPRVFRPAVYRGYSRIFGATPDDAELGLTEYSSINAFFTRTLKPGLRPIA